MTEYLIASRAAIIFWTSFAVVPAEILFDAIGTRMGAPRRGAITLLARSCGRWRKKDCWSPK
jgi:hypothetical protein